MPEVVDQVRRNVPAAADVSPFAIEGRVSMVVGTIPYRRGKRDLAGQNTSTRPGSRTCSRSRRRA